MKLTWFGGTTLRAHIGGQIIVADAEGASAAIDRVELLSGADRLLNLQHDDGTVPQADAAGWRRERPRSALEASAEPELRVMRLAPGTVLVDAPGEPALVLIADAGPEVGRWADGAVLVLLGAAAVAAAPGLLDAGRPRLLALALPAGQVDAAFDALRDGLGDAGLVALEPGLALEA